MPVASSQFASSPSLAKSWAQYHIQERKIEAPKFEDVKALLPLLRDQVNTLDMQVHIMNLNKLAVDALNPGQTPVDVSDCPV